MQKLTDIWQNLDRWHDPPENQEAVNQHSQIDEQDNQQSDHNEQANLEQHDEVIVDREQYKNLYWTGVLSMQRVMQERISRKPIVDHIIEALSEIQQLED